MTLLNPHNETTESHRGWMYVVIVLVLAAGAGYFLMPSPQPPPKDVKQPVQIAPPIPPAASPAEAETVGPAEIASEPTEVTTPTVILDPAPPPEPITPPPPVSPPTVLRVTSDINGADVFIDRQYAGTTPFESHDITPGRHRINISTAGYEGHVENVEITDQLTTLSIIFRQVHLDQRIPVIHKHRFGNCEGQLVASTSGLHYRTDHDDTFEVTLEALEEFSVDYLEHNLRIKVRNGRTYNFTDQQENADALFVFQREVEEARERLVRGDPPASQKGLSVNVK